MTALTAFLLGLAGSLHCVGMCGAIALALPVPAEARWALLKNALLYNFGRITTYGVLGAAFGLIGKAVVVAGWQQGLTIFAGFAMIFIALYAFQVESTVLKVPVLDKVFAWVSGSLRRILKNPTPSAAYSVGLLNGLIPCGLVYAAIAGTMTTTGAAAGSLFMIAFGLGTLPLMFATSLGGQFIKQYLRGKWRLLQPALLCMVGIIALSRGFNLDLEWFRSVVPKAMMICH